MLHAGLDNGVRKLKLLGGEPLLRTDLPHIISSLRTRDPDLDISIISCGVAAVERLDACFEAGLTRCNVSVHGWSREAFGLCGGTARMFELRSRFLDALVGYGRPLKVNYVYTGTEVEPDLDGLLSWAASRDLVVNVLDDLSDPDLGPEELIHAVRRLRGEPIRRSIDEDPHSLPTTHLHWADGLEVEIKSQHLGVEAPWRSCRGCFVRDRCREGIAALRLSQRGELRPCMDRHDLGRDLADAVRRDGRPGAADQWRGFLEEEAA